MQLAKGCLVGCLCRAQPQHAHNLQAAWRGLAVTPGVVEIIYLCMMCHTLGSVKRLPGISRQDEMACRCRAQPQHAYTLWASRLVASDLEQPHAFSLEVLSSSMGTPCRNAVKAPRSSAAPLGFPSWMLLALKTCVASVALGQTSRCHVRMRLYRAQRCYHIGTSNSYKTAQQVGAKLSESHARHRLRSPMKAMPMLLSP